MRTGPSDGRAQASDANPAEPMIPLKTHTHLQICKDFPMADLQTLFRRFKLLKSFTSDGSHHTLYIYDIEGRSSAPHLR